MKAHRFLTMAAIGAALTLPMAWAVPKVLLVGIDGVRPDEITLAATPNYDALVAAGFLNSFVRHADSVKIANIAQIVTVIAVDGESITLDTTHPLAGKTLHFKVEVLEVRDATTEELEHGHVHGPTVHAARPGPGRTAERALSTSVP